MRIIKPEWLRHDADKKKLTAIFSLDFHPDGTRLATAGMDNKIRLWSTQAIKDAAGSGDAADGSATPRLLSTLTAHSGAVMCARFSNGAGKYLASGADDMVVLIWERDESEAGGGHESGNILGHAAGGSEVWRPFRRLTGHESDVCDLAWAPDNRYLATCGLDNTIFIWHGRSFERVAKLTGHKQFVKGLTFDPAGRYLASQSDDKTLKIWRTSDWALQATVGKPFEDNIFSTYFRRPSWSPDGDCIAAANAANGKVPVAAVLRRGTWTADLSFVGHRAAIEAVRFNPRVFNVADTTAAHSETKEKTVTVCAAGGQDRGVSVWLTSQHMPIAAATSLFQGNLMDLAWHTVESAAGQPHDVIAYLAACSYDGTVAILEFTRAELGSPVSQADQEALLARHGWTRLQVGSGYKRSHGDGYDDDDDDVDRDGDGGGNGNGDDNDGGGYARKHARPLVESIEQVKLEERGAELSHALPQSKSQSQSQSHNLSQNPIPQQPATESAPATATKEPDTPPITMPVPTRTPNGRKRVAPVFLRPLGGYTTPAAVSIPDTQTQTQAQAQALTSAANATVTVVAPSSDDQRYPVNAPLWIEARVLGSRQLRSQNDTTSSSAASGAALSLAPQSLIHAQSISAARVHLNVPKVVAQVTARAHSSFSKPGIQQAKKLPMLVAYNSSGPSGGQAASTTSLKGGSHLVCTVPQDPPAQSGSEAPQHSWTVYFSASVVMLAASQQITAAMLTDGSLHWFDTGSGTRLLPPLMSEAHPAYLVCKQQHCLLLDCVGQLTVWDTERLEALVDHVSIAPLLYASEMRVRDDHNAMLSDRPSSSASHGTAADADGGSQATIAGDKKNSTANGSSSSSSSVAAAAAAAAASATDKQSKRSAESATATTTNATTTNAATASATTANAAATATTSNSNTSTKHQQQRQTSLDTASSDDQQMARAPRRHPPAVALTSVDISDNGTPLLSFSDGRAYTYHSKLRTWLRLVNPQDHRASDFHIHPPGSAPILSKQQQQQQQQQQQTKANSTLLAFARTTESPLDYLQELGYRQHQATEKANASKRGNSSAERLELVKNAGVRRLVTLDHLESLVRTADIIGSSDDVLRYSDSLARALARGGDTSRVSHWLTDLLGPPLAKGLCPPAEPSMLADAARWNPCLASVPKRQILERILPVLATNRHLQALVTEYSKALESLL